MATHIGLVSNFWQESPLSYLDTVDVDDDGKPLNSKALSQLSFNYRGATEIFNNLIAKSNKDVENWSLSTQSINSAHLLLLNTKEKLAETFKGNVSDFFPKEFEEFENSKGVLERRINLLSEWDLNNSYPHLFSDKKNNFNF